MGTATFPGTLENVSRICEFVVKGAREAGLDDNAVYQVELAVDEACTNIIEHAYRGESKGVIECSYQVNKGSLTVVLQDYGRSFNPNKVPVPNVKGPLKNLKARGAGLYLIRNLMDEVHFEFSKKDGNRLTLVKRKS
jgi:serine/threonine-protein kinase RsbW